ncbi:MAG TPA: CocE/NonD family hydrolase [Dongiaceae bacterium]
MQAKIRTEYPHKIQHIENLWIPLADGTRLAARMFLPEGAEKDPVPALLEYLPYRKRDSMRPRDTPMQSYYAGHGYAAIRVDIRGTGDSDGLINDEYLKQEQDDAVEVIAWIARQPWCSGAVGMHGMSWGGFNALQLAARQPPALKAIITMGSTDDRYASDVHYMGGCMTKDNVDWGAVMFAHVSTPPDPEIVGARWREMWLQRLENLRPWIIPWLAHQRRDEYWQHGSVCQDFSRIKIPVYAVNGWADNYCVSIPRLLAGLSGPRKGLIGPWGHSFPQHGTPGPAIGWLQEALRWWDHWLKGKDTGIMAEPMLRAWMQESAPPAVSYPVRDGRWVAEESWPSPRLQPCRWFLNPGRLDERPSPETKLIVASPLAAGLGAGEIGRYGEGAEFATDQREDDGGSLVFVGDPLPERLEFLGAPVVELTLSADAPQALVAVRLNEVFADGRSARVTYGVLNLSHRDRHENPAPLVAGEEYLVRVQLDDIAHAFAPGSRIAVAISNHYWPVLWPSPTPTALTVVTGASTLTLPVRPPRAEDGGLRAFAEPETGAATPVTEIDPGRTTNRTITRDLLAGTTTVLLPRDGGSHHLPELGLTMHETGEVFHQVTGQDPASATTWTRFGMGRERGDWRVRTETETRVTCTATKFHLQATIDAYEGDARIFTRNWSMDFPRDNL